MKKFITIHVDEFIWAQIKSEAALSHKTISGVLHEIFTAYLAGNLTEKKDNKLEGDNGKKI